MKSIKVENMTGNRAAPMFIEPTHPPRLTLYPWNNASNLSEQRMPVLWLKSGPQFKSLWNKQRSHACHRLPSPGGKCLSRWDSGRWRSRPLPTQDPCFKALNQYFFFKVGLKICSQHKSIWRLLLNATKSAFGFELHPLGCHPACLGGATV